MTGGSPAARAAGARGGGGGGGRPRARRAAPERPPARINLRFSFSWARLRSPLCVPPPPPPLQPLGRSPRPSLRGSSLQNLVSTSSRSSSRSFAILNGRVVPSGAKLAGGFHGNARNRRVRPRAARPLRVRKPPLDPDARSRGWRWVAGSLGRGPCPPPRVGCVGPACPAALPSAPVQPWARGVPLSRSGACPQTPGHFPPILTPGRLGRL